MCDDGILKAAAHPSTVEFHHITGYSTSVPGGNREIIQRFDAKNGYNLKLTYDAHCIITPGGRISVSVSEVRN
jgi:hypothetical protein